APAEGQEKGPTRREAVGPGLNSGSSGGKAGTAPAAAGRVGVGKGETGALHRGDVVDGDAGEILRAEPVHEDPHAIDGVHHVVVEEANLAPRALSTLATSSSSARKLRCINKKAPIAMPLSTHPLVRLPVRNSPSANTEAYTAVTPATQLTQDRAPPGMWSP